MFERGIFDKSFLSSRFSAVDNDDANDDIEDPGIDTDPLPAPASPGMEYLLNEQMEASRKLPKNVKYNQAFDVAKLCAEYMKNTPNAMYEIYLEAF